MTITTRRISDEALDVLSRCTVDGTVVYLPEGQLERPLYVAVNTALEAIGGKWNRSQRGHVFDSDPTDALESVVLTGEYVKPQDYGQFFTPEPLARVTVALAGIEPHMSVLEPSAGQGALAIPAAAIVGRHRVTCCELLPANARHLDDNGFTEVHCADFLTQHSFDGQTMFDRVVMNPPFAKQQDIQHVEHAWGFVRRGGRLVAIMSAGVLFRTDARARGFRALVEMHDGTITSNPERSFHSAGTDVHTVTVVMDKAA